MLANTFHACHDSAVTTKQLLIEARLGGQRVHDLVSRRRSKGASWQSIADEIHDLTGVVVSRETLRLWANAPQKAA